MFFSFLLAVSFCLPLASFANPRVETDRICSLRLIYQDNGKPISGASFQLYFVADVSDNVTFSMKDKFVDSGIALVAEDDEVWASDAETLSSYITLESTKGVDIDAVAQGKTNSEGVLEFTNLETGLYLLKGSTEVVDGYTYEPVDTLLMLPTVQDDNSLDYDTVVYPKKSRSYKDDSSSSETGGPSSSTTETTYLNVVKIWNDTGYESSRPSSVTVVLMQDGKEYDRVVLTKDNNWRYRWEGLNSDSKWELAEEDVPTNYTVTTVLDGKSFIVTNTRKKPSSSTGTKRNEGTTAVTTEATTTEGTTEVTTANSDETPNTPDETTVHRNPSSSDDSTEVTTDEDGLMDGDMDRFNISRDADETTETTSEEQPDTSRNGSNGNSQNTQNSQNGNSSKGGTLPQTGQPWLPIPMLIVCGLILMMTGRLVSGDKGDDKIDEKN
jgi:hypothetical protein